MKKIAALCVGLSFVWSAAGCCCSHLGGNACGYGPTFAPACPGGACGVPGAMAPGVYQGAALTTTQTVTAAAPLAAPVIYTAQQPAYVTTSRTAMVESLPTY